MRTKKMPILLAAGHGGKDTGAVSPDGAHNERDQAIIIVDKIAEHLRGLGHVVTVAPHKHDTHETIPWVNANFNYGDVWAIEVHRDSADTIKEPDASTRFGIYHGSSKVSTEVAAAFLNAAKSIGAAATSWSRDQSESRHNRLGWINQPEPLSHLIELAFMEGRNDAEHIYWLAYTAALAINKASESIP